MLAIGAFLVQFTVQGAWGVIPVHLNELSPLERARHVSRLRLSARQSAGVGQRDVQAGLAVHFGGNYGLALALVAGTVAIVIAGLTAAGTEAKGVVFAKAEVAAATA